ncbi:MAG TPA: hypothetical protein VNH18_30020, partial [Bryobacteraceae bacterium]|nr:hypothetical protein [Bryobacteraceae bacterium]
MFDFLLIRVLFVIVVSMAAAWFRPAGVEPWVAAGGGALFACIAILLETRIEKVSLKRLIGMAVGLLTGLSCAALISVILGRDSSSPVRLI